MFSTFPLRAVPIMYSGLKILLFFLCIISTLSPILNHEFHPLDSLTPSELNQVKTIVNETIYSSSSSSSSQSFSFHYVGLNEPDKPVILSWLSSDQNFTKIPPRQAFVLARIDHKNHELIVDLDASSVISNKVHDGHGYPLLNSDEQTAANNLPFTYAPFIASIEKRGLKLGEVVCQSFTIGWFGEEKTKRVVRVMCYYLDGTVNLYMRPIEGITVTVDLDEMKIVGFRDRVIVPVPKAEGTDYRQGMQKQPMNSPTKERGPSFAIEDIV